MRLQTPASVPLAIQETFATNVSLLVYVSTRAFLAPYHH